MDKIVFANAITDITAQDIKLWAPIIIIYICLVIFCLYRLAKDRVKYLPKWGWALVILFVSTIGPLLFLTLGRERD